MIVQVRERDLNVVDLRRPVRIAGKPVLTREARVARAPERDGVAAQLTAVTAYEAAAVDQQHAGAVGGGRPVEVGTEVTVAHPADEHRLHFDPIWHAFLHCPLLGLPKREPNQGSPAYRQ